MTISSDSEIVSYQYMEIMQEFPTVSEKKPTSRSNCLGFGGRGCYSVQVHI